jgi:hypothetical protein
MRALAVDVSLVKRQFALTNSMHIQQIQDFILSQMARAVHVWISVESVEMWQMQVLGLTWSLLKEWGELSIRTFT